MKWERERDEIRLNEVTLRISQDHLAQSRALAYVNELAGSLLR